MATCNSVPAYTYLAAWKSAHCLNVSAVVFKDAVSALLTSQICGV